MAEIRSAFGRAVRFARQRKSWSQEELAQAAGLDRSHLSHIERGQRDAGLGVQERIATALGLTLTELIAQAEQEREHRRRAAAERRGRC